MMFVLLLKFLSIMFLGPYALKEFILLIKVFRWDFLGAFIHLFKSILALYIGLSILSDRFLFF